MTKAQEEFDRQVLASLRRNLSIEVSKGGAGFDSAGSRITVRLKLGKETLSEDHVDVHEGEPRNPW